MKLNRIMAVAFCGLLSTGCVASETYQRYSSGSVGCPPREIAISDDGETFTESSWTAKCRGKTFYCAVPMGGGSATCTQAQAAAPAAH